MACARLGMETLLVKMSFDTVGAMSCNPAIGGVGKGQLVKEIDALGGEMARAADHGGIQFRQLNMSKGIAARSSRAQEDRLLYKAYMQGTIKGQKGLSVLEDKVEDIVAGKGIVRGVATERNGECEGRQVIITAGTFMNGLIHIGLNHIPGGRIGEESVRRLSSGLKAHGIKLMRFKTGTCPRLDGRSIDFNGLDVQEGDHPPRPFSFETTTIKNKQVPCYITYTNETTHAIVRKGLDRSPLYTGVIKSTGVRYCPSLEDKVVRFADRTRHQIFLEPEGLDTHEYYPNGLATSLPEDVQEAFLHSIPGLENVLVTKWGYGIEYDLIDPTQLYPTLECKGIRGLYFAGQVNGTTGYEEAAAQGLIAGINAGLKIKGKSPFIMDRSMGYIGVLIDDLVTKGTNEPYRMFTSRVEYRLLLREDNADRRLTPLGYKIGLVAKDRYTDTREKEKKRDDVIRYLKTHKVGAHNPPGGEARGYSPLPVTIRKGTSLLELLRRPEVTYEMLKTAGGNNRSLPDVSGEIETQIENEVKYEGYINKQLREVRHYKDLEKIRIPGEIDYRSIAGLSNEIKEKLGRARPLSLGQASRISGVTPVAISILMVYLKNK
ncbi:MAG: tRNA uridine-5-carboxymethylaminomethyl(34) synthesis enzyme MnmG [Candidatus Omnitrophica bacterium]|nr:tRNA uridine-5-carboxymethylaminomethyl(34) synthesis enzyme MnmG [Candidatus Omnitrophota bacterium]